MKKGIKILVSFILFVFIVGVGGYAILDNLAKRNSNIPINNPDLTKVSSGEYEGEYSISPVSVKVKVIVGEEKYKKIDILKHENGLGKPGEEVVDKVLEHQSLDVDTISGATVSSKCILKAIENSLIGDK